MKKNTPLSLYNSDNPPIDPKEKSAASPGENKSPYIKTILSGSVKMFARENDLPVKDPDRMAALRYIKESALLKKLYTGKISC
jgi:hypothetical protein